MTCPPADPSFPEPGCSTLDSLWPDSSTLGCASPTSFGEDCSPGGFPEPSSGTTSEPCEEVKLLPTPNASPQNYDEDVQQWRERAARMKIKHGNGNGVGTPLGIAVRELAESTSSPAGSPAREPAALASRTGLSTPRLFCGTRCDGSLASFNPGTSSSRTSPTYSGWLRPQGSLLDPCGEPFSGTWPRSGSMLSGTVFPLLPLAPRISVTGSSPLLPSPLARTQSGTEISGDARTGGPMLQEAVLGLLPTPEASDASGGRVSKEKGGRRLSGARRAITLATAIHHQPGGSQWSGATTGPPSPDGKPSTGLRLNPSFVGWMMGTPSCGECGREWTDPECLHSVTAFMSTADGSSASRSGSTCERGGGDLDPV